ncbi:NAD-dependent epimerase/dehydratase family protein [Microcella flavibacter]|uniref:NAD-dependent epimerase/dehydratase family protein n=1 Tax=Microcella flavibacter TaxID=1804990 RepID=UPI0014564B0A|nr:NAD(P)-dependent oxidoreductase [Microcella flavibacter]
MILVTGGTGFIAAHVQRRLLNAGHEVIATSRYDYRPESLFVLGPNVPRLERADPRDSDSLRPLFARYRPDTVIHLDAYVNPVALQTDPLRAVEYNVMETMNLLELSREFGCGRLVFSSSIAVLPTIQYEPIDARHPIVLPTEGSGGGFYGTSKAMSELLGLAYASAFGVDFRCVRPSAVFGFGMQWPIGIKPVIENLVEGKPAVIARHAPPRDYTPVQDVAAVVAALVDCPPETDRVVYAGTGRALVSSDELLRTVQALFPDGDVTMGDEALDPTGVESNYRGMLDMGPVRTQLGVRPAFDSLAAALTAYAEDYRAFLGRAG